jgi:hypothetical protein
MQGGQINLEAIESLLNFFKFYFISMLLIILLIQYLVIVFEKN